MDLILTSFGISHLQGLRKSTDIFFRMPPARLSNTGQYFMPDYAALLLTDRIVIDQKTYERLICGRDNSYGNVALMAKVLHDEGFVRLEDFDSVIARNRELLEKMLERDMRELDSWVRPLKESVEEWRRVVDGFRRPLREDFLAGRLKYQEKDQNEGECYEDVSHYMAELLHRVGNIGLARSELVREALYSSRKRRESQHRDALREVLSDHLSYVNANLLLANELSGGIGIVALTREATMLSASSTCVNHTSCALDS